MCVNFFFFFGWGGDTEQIGYLKKKDLFLYDLEGATDKSSIPGWKADTHCLTQAKFRLSPPSAGDK